MLEHQLFIMWFPHEHALNSLFQLSLTKKGINKTKYFRCNTIFRDLETGKRGH